MRYIITFILLIHNCIFLTSQNLIDNGGFEHFFSCPDGISQISKLENWYQVSKSPDYFNCLFDRTPLDNFESSIYSGNGSIGLLSYFDGLQSYSESVGQFLLVPLVPGKFYKFDFVAKTINRGSYSNSCRSLELYGFSDDYAGNDDFVHLSEKESSLYLGESNVITKDNWKFYSFVFSPIDTITNIAISLQEGNCNQYVIIDSMSLTGINFLKNEDECLLYLNPVIINAPIEFVSKKVIQTIEIYDLKGVLINKSYPNSNSHLFSLREEGVYFAYVKTKIKTFTKKIMVINTR